MKKRLLSALLALCLVLGMIPTTLLTANAATAVKVTNVTVTGLPGSAPTAGAKVDLTGIAVEVAGYKEGTAAETASAHSNVFVTYSTEISGAEKRTDGNYYWKAGSVATITIRLKSYSTSSAYTSSVGLTSVTGSETNGWNISKSGSTVTAKYDFNGTAGIQNSATTAVLTADTIPYLDSATITGSYVDAANPDGVDITTAWDGTGDPEVTLTVVKDQTATLYLNSLDEKQNKGGAISVVSGSVPSDLISVTSKGSNTFAVTGKMAYTGATFLLQTAKAGNCDVKQFKVAVNVLDPLGGFTLTSPVSTLELSDTSRTLSATVTSSGTTSDVTISASTVAFDVSDERVLTVAADGKLTPVGAGTATVTATYLDSGNAMATSKVTIKVVRDTVTVPVPQPKDYTYMSGDTKFAWTTQPDITRVNVLMNGVQVAALNDLDFAPAGNNTVTVSLKDPDKDQWADGTAADKTFTWRVEPKRLNSTSVTGSITGTYEYTGKAYTVDAAEAAQKLTLTVTDSATGAPNSGALQLGVDYTIASYHNNVYAGTDSASVTITGKGNYTGTQTYTFSIAAVDDGVELTLPSALAKQAGNSVDLKSLLTQTTIPDFDFSKLTTTGFVWTLKDADKTKATLTGSTLKLNSTLGAGATVEVNFSYNGTYDANGDGVAEYDPVTSASGAKVTVTVATKVQSVTVPTGATGLVYNGKEQTGVADGELFNLTGTVTAPTGYTAETDGKVTDAGKYYTVVSLDNTKKPAGTALAWADGSTGPKAVTWEIAKATPTVTVSFTPLLEGGKTLDDADLTVRTAVGVNGANLGTDKEGTAAWNAAVGTYIVQGASYEWTWTPKASSATETNYNPVTGSAVIFGNTDGTSTSTDTPDKDTSQTGTTTTTVTSPDGSTTVIETNHDTGVVTYRTTGYGNQTSSVVVYTNGVLTSATASNYGTAGAVAYIPLRNVTWGTVALINGVLNYDAAVPAEGLGGMWVALPRGESTITVRDASRYFPDVSSGQWFAPGVNFTSARGLIQGDNGYYKPYDTLNHGQIWAMLGRYAGAFSIAQSSGNSWYVTPQSWAYQNNISNTAYYSEAATREDLAVMLYNTYSRFVGTPTTTSSYLYNITDYASVSTNARTAVAWCVQTGIIAGYPDGSFRGSQTVQRDAAALMMARFSYVALGVSIPGTLAQ